MKKKPKINNLQRGILSEKLVEAKFIENGFNTLLPRAQAGTIDMLVEKENKFKRIQIKTAYYEKKSDCFRTILMGSNHRKYDLNKFDYFAVYIYEYDSVYLVPTKYAKQTSLIFYPHREKGTSKYTSASMKIDYNKFLNNFNI